MNTHMLTTDIMTGVTLAGLKFAQFQHFLETVGLPSIDRSVYDTFRQEVVHPSIDDEFEKDVSARVQRIKEEGGRWT